MATEDFARLADTVQQAADEAVGAVPPTEWDENHLSFRLVVAMRDVLRQVGSLNGPAGLAYVNAEAYKITGSAEHDHGDIAVAVQHCFPGGHQIRGLGFYEAKAADETGRYPAFKRRQLQRLVTSTPRLGLLLYERERQPVSWNPFDVGFDGLMYGAADSRSRARVRVVGGNIAAGFKSPDLPAATYGESFGFHLVSRYLLARDLDYAREPARTLDRWLKATERSAPIVVSIAVSPFEHAPVQLSLPGYQYELVPPPRALLV